MQLHPNLVWTYGGANGVATAETLAAVGTVQPAVTLANVYDAVGDRRQVEASPGLTALGTTFYDYDLAGRLKRVTTPRVR